MARNGHSVPRHEARSQYVWLPEQKRIHAYSLKVGSGTLLTSLPQPRNHMCQPEVHSAGTKGLPVHMYVRHPLDRMVSAWSWFTQKQTSYIKPILDMSPGDHKVLMDRKTPFDVWVNAALRHYNPHWYPQVEYHSTREGELVPSVIKTLDCIGPTKMHETKHAPWEDVYEGHEALKDYLEDIYYNDIALYNLAKEAGENGFNTRAGGLFRQSRRDVWHDGLEVHC